MRFENDYPTGLDMEQFDHVELISCYNNNYYKGVKSGDVLFGKSDDDRTTEWYLIRNCEIPSIINDLKEEYGDEFEEIKNSEIKIHTFEKFKKYSIKFDYPKNDRMTYSKFGLYWIQIRHNSDSWWWYCEDNDEWVDITKSERYTNTNTAHFGHSLKAVIRKIKKWNLPAGVIITAHGRYRNSSVEIRLK